MSARDKGVSIISGGTKDGAHLRGRDVELELKSSPVDPRVKSLLYRLAETNHFALSRLAELATLLDQLIDVVQNFANISENMKAKMERIHRDVKGEDVDADITTEN